MPEIPSSQGSSGASSGATQSPSGPWPPEGRGNTSSIEDIDKAIESLNREGLHAQEKATKLLELEHAKEVLKQQYVRSAAVVTGQLPMNANGAELKIETTDSSQGSSGAKAGADPRYSMVAHVMVQSLTYLFNYFVLSQGLEMSPEATLQAQTMIQAIAALATAGVLNFVASSSSKGK